MFLYTYIKFIKKKKSSAWLGPEGLSAMKAEIQIFSATIDVSTALSKSIARPANYIAHAVRRKTASSGPLHIGTTETTHLLLLASADEPTLTMAVEAAKALVERLTRPATPKAQVKRVRLSLSEVGFLHRDKLASILSDQLGRVVHLAMHGSRALPQYGNRATATVLVPRSFTIPTEFQYTHESNTLTFLCKLHKDQLGPSNIQDAKAAPFKSFTTAAARKRNDDAAAASAAAGAGPGDAAAAPAPAATLAATPASPPTTRQQPSSLHPPPTLPSPTPCSSSSALSSSSSNSSLSPSSSSSSSPSSFAASSASASRVPSSLAPESVPFFAAGGATGGATTPDIGRTTHPALATATAVAPAAETATAPNHAANPDEGFTVVRSSRKRPKRSKVVCTLLRPQAPPPSPSSPLAEPSRNRFDMEEVDDDPTDFSGVEGGEEVAVSPTPSPPHKRRPKATNSPPLPGTSSPRKDQSFADDRTARGGTPTSRPDWLRPTAPTNSASPGPRPGKPQ